MSVARKRFKTALPKEPVPPVIMRVLFLNSDMFFSYVYFKDVIANRFTGVAIFRMFRQQFLP